MSKKFTFNQYWFRPKTYGYGFFPISWEGWIATFALLGIILALADIAGIFTEMGPNREAAILFVWRFVLTLIVATYFFDKKTDGELGWRWGQVKKTRTARKRVVKKPVRKTTKKK